MRGTMQVRRDSVPFRVYESWRRNKGYEKTERPQIDLCHFTRVLLIFGPWRWFWQSPTRVGLPPYIVVAVAAAVAALAAGFYTATYAMLAVTMWIGIILGVVAAIFAILALCFWIYDLDTAKWDRRANKVGDVLLDVILAVGSVFGWVGDHVVVPVGRRFFQKPLFSVGIGPDLVCFTPFGILLITAAVGGLGLAFYFSSFWAGVSIGGFLAVVAIVAGVILGGKRLLRWLDAKWPETADKPPKPKKAHPTRDVIWGFLVAKKHRICPLIQPVDESNA